MEKKLQNLKKIVLAYGISGNEIYSGITNVIFKIVKNINSNTITDDYGNVISIFGEGEKTILIDAHLDEVGFMVSKKNNGKIKLIPIGNISIQKVDNSEAFVLKKNIDGKIFQDTSDIIFEAKNSNQQDEISLGDIISFKKTFYSNNTIIKATALDNRIGCSCLFELMEKINTKNIRIIYTFTAGEEKNNAILDKIAMKYNVDFGIIVDAAYAKPVSFSTDNMSIPELGMGCAIQYLGTNFMVNKNIINKIEECAKNNNISFQREIPLPDLGGTNFSKLQQVGILGCIINIPVRNQHTQVSEANIKDYNSAVKLIESVVNMIQQGAL